MGGGGFMAKSEGESSRSAGRPCPALQKLQGSENKSADSGGELQVVQATPTELAAIIQCLKARAESAPADARIGRASALARTGLRFAAVVLLATGVGVGLGDGDLFDDVGPNVAQQPSRLVHGADVRQAGEQPGDKSTGSGGGAGSGSDDGTPTGQPECVAWAQICVYRLPDGRCQATEQPCRLFSGCELHGALENIQTMLVEIRAGVVAAPRAIEKSESQKAELLAGGQPSKQRRKNTIANGILGRLRWENGFSDVWLGGEHYDLRGRAKARFCLLYLMAKLAFNAESARHLEYEINPFVRKKCQLPPLPEGAQANLRIQHFFNDPSGKTNRLGRELVKAAGRNGRFYLQVV
jgi:hypothetical protein